MLPQFCRRPVSWLVKFETLRSPRWRLEVISLLELYGLVTKSTDRCFREYVSKRSKWNPRVAYLFLDTLEVLVDGEEVNLDSVSTENPAVYPGMHLSRPLEGVGVTVTFFSGFSMNVAAVAGFMSLSSQAPPSFRDKTRGLMGTYNGDVEDDFMTPQGNVIPINSTSRVIHYSFGETCKRVPWYLVQESVKTIFQSALRKRRSLFTCQ